MVEDYTILNGLDENVIKTNCLLCNQIQEPEIRVTNYIITIEPPHDKTNKMACAPSEDSDQPRHPPSLISLRCPHEKGLGPELPIEHTVKPLIRLGGCPG